MIANMNGPERSKQTCIERIGIWARKLKGDIMTLYFAARHPGTPIYARVFAFFVVGYALSPIDLIPDFVPVLGYLDDILIVPLGIAVAVRMIPEDVLNECRERGKARHPPAIRKSRIVLYIVVMIWLVSFYLLYRWRLNK